MLTLSAENVRAINRLLGWQASGNVGVLLLKSAQLSNLPGPPSPLSEAW